MSSTYKICWLWSVHPCGLTCGWFHPPILSLLLLFILLLPILMMEPSTSELQLTSWDGDSGGPCLSCAAIHQILKPGDRFHCHTCNKVATGPASTHIDPPLAEPTINFESSNQRPASVQDLFTQLTKKSMTQQLASTQVSFKSAHDEVLATFLSHGKVAEYQKLDRGPMSQVVGKAHRVSQHSTKTIAWYTN